MTEWSKRKKNAQALALKGSYGFFAYKDKDNKALDILEDTKLKAAGDNVAISSYTEIGNEDDATSLENMKLALEFIKNVMTYEWKTDLSL